MKTVKTKDERLWGICQQVFHYKSEYAGHYALVEGIMQTCNCSPTRAFNGAAKMLEKQMVVVEQRNGGTYLKLGTWKKN